MSRNRCCAFSDVEITTSYRRLCKTPTTNKRPGLPGRWVASVASTGRAGFGALGSASLRSRGIFSAREDVAAAFFNPCVTHSITQRVSNAQGELCAFRFKGLFISRRGRKGESSGQLIKFKSHPEKRIESTDIPLSLDIFISRRSVASWKTFYHEN